MAVHSSSDNRLSLFIEHVRKNCELYWILTGLSAARIKSCRTPITTRNLGSGGDLMESHIDLAADLNDEEDEGLGWSTLSEARDPGLVRPGVTLVAGNRQAQAVVRVVAVDDDGQVHFTVLPGSVDKNRHLIGRAMA
jgi:hypothetical protein